MSGRTASEMEPDIGRNSMKLFVNYYNDDLPLWNYEMLGKTRDTCFDSNDLPFGQNVVGNYKQNNQQWDGLMENERREIIAKTSDASTL